MKNTYKPHTKSTKNAFNTLFVGTLAVFLGLLMVLGTTFSATPPQTIAEEDPVIGYTESGLEIKQHLASTVNDFFNGYSYITIGGYNWVIIGYYASSNTSTVTGTGTGTGDYQMYSLDAPVITPANYDISGTVSYSNTNSSAKPGGVSTSGGSSSASYKSTGSASQTQKSSSSTYAITGQEITQETPNSAGYGSYQALNGGVAGTAIANDTGTSTDVMSRFDTDFRITGPMSKSITATNTYTFSFPYAVSNSEIPNGCVLCMAETGCLTTTFGNSSFNYNSSTLKTNCDACYTNGSYGISVVKSYIQQVTLYTAYYEYRNVTSRTSLPSCTSFVFPLATIEYSDGSYATTSSNPGFYYQNFRLDTYFTASGSYYYSKSQTGTCLSTTTNMWVRSGGGSSGYGGYVWYGGDYDSTSSYSSSLCTRPCFCLKVV